MENEVGELTIDLREQSREFVQNLVSVLREQRHFVSEGSVPFSEKDREASKQTNAGSASVDDDVTTKNKQGYIIQFSDGGEIPEAGNGSHTRQKQNMGAAIDYLIEEHGLIDEIEMPHSPPKARKNCSINTEPIHPTGEDMRQPYELINGYYLHTSLNTRGKKTRIRDLAEQVGVDVDFIGEWKK